MKTPLQKVIEILKDLHAENDGHTAYQQGILDCITVCVDNLQYERDVIKHVPDIQLELFKENAIELADENLSVTHFQNGDRISEALTTEQWVEYGEQEKPAFTRNGDDFYYNHYAVTDKRGLAPEGWFIPTEKDMEYIIKHELWKDLPKTGFRRSNDGTFNFAGSSGLYWSSTVDESFASYLSLNSSYAGVYSYYRASGLSVRCIRNID